MLPCLPDVPESNQVWYISQSKTDADCAGSRFAQLQQAMFLMQ